jgi:hypothetical protein
VLAAVADRDAASELARAHDELQAMAERLTDPAHRQRLLRAVPVHRAIVAAVDSGMMPPLPPRDVSGLTTG